MPISDVGLQVSFREIRAKHGSYFKFSRTKFQKRRSYFKFSPTKLYQQRTKFVEYHKEMFVNMLKIEEKREKWSVSVGAIL